MNFNNLPLVTQRLIILNALVFLFTGFIAPSLQSTFALYYFDSPSFLPYQLLTHMFTHGGLMHIFFNMFALFMFGAPLERVWGPQKFLIFYLITGLGAVFLHQLVDYFQVQSLLSQLTPAMQETVQEEGMSSFLASSLGQMDPSNMVEPIQNLMGIYRTPVVGASGAVFGVLAGFAILFPNTELMMLFIPMPIKAKYFVLIYAAVELFLGVSRFGGDNIAHFAHLGGALFGFILVKYWNSKKDNFY